MDDTTVAKHKPIFLGLTDVSFDWDNIFDMVPGLEDILIERQWIIEHANEKIQINQIQRIYGNTMEKNIGSLIQL